MPLRSRTPRLQPSKPYVGAAAGVGGLAPGSRPEPLSEARLPHRTTMVRDITPVRIIRRPPITRPDPAAMRLPTACSGFAHTIPAAARISATTAIVIPALEFRAGT